MTTPQKSVKQNKEYRDVGDKDLLETEEKELNEIESALKDFQKARRNLINKLKEYSSTQALSISDLTDKDTK